ncbi:MAG TPA: lysylphosphatidylglycerol synthase domain-containing protein, partial [Kofleriaceae bacterium]|nr:lysylphosphatidylglycerol synthase domain-containing protein [Kofleriaceae bacterium]
MRARLRFAAMLTGFVVLTALGAWWAAPDRETLARSVRELAALGWANAVLLGALAIALLVAEMIRFHIFGRVIGVRVGARAAFDAAIANDLFSWISPGGVLGEPAAIYVMARRGVPVDAALVISFGKFATSFALFMGGAAILVGAGFGPALSEPVVALIVWTTGFGVVLVGSFTVGAMAPAASLRAIGAAEAWALRRRLAG